MVEFVYEKTIQDKLDSGQLKILCENPLHEVRGLALDSGEIYINLSATLWKIPDEDFVIEQLSKTIVHEQLHNLLMDIKTETTDEILQEELIVQVMADQIGSIIIPNQNRNI